MGTAVGRTRSSHGIVDDMDHQNIRKGTATIFHQSGKPYTSISNHVVNNIRNPDALAIWTFLQSKDNGWNVIKGFLMDHFGLGRDRYAKAMRDLKVLGLVEYATVLAGDGSLKGTRVFVNYEIPENRHLGKPTSRKTDKSENDLLLIKDLKEIKDQDTNAPAKPDASKTVKTEKKECPDLLEAFELFWLAGMRKANKKGALKSFQAACKRLKADPQEFANKLAVDVAARKKSKQLGFDSLHPTSYLNNDRWEDEIVTTADTPSANSANDRWWNSDAGIERKAKAEGIVIRSGESYRDLADRIRMLEQQGELASQKTNSPPPHAPAVEDTIKNIDIPF